MNAHKFVPVSGTKQCSVCGKTRGAKAHKDARAQADELAAQVESDVAMEAEMDAEAAELGNQIDAEAEVRDATDATDAAQAEPWGIPPVPDFQPGPDGLLPGETAEGVQETYQKAEKVEVKPAKTSTAVKAEQAKKKAAAPTASIWVGWRITNAAVLDKKSSLAKKLQDAKPTGDLDRTVKLTVEELQVLDAIAAKFQEPGHTGPEQYSGRALRGRIAAALAKIEGK
jgi:hypothetical protein